MINLQLIRRQKGMSQKELANKLGITVTELSKIENDWYKRISSRIRASLDEIFGPEWTSKDLLSPIEPKPGVPANPHSTAA